MSELERQIGRFVEELKRLYLKRHAEGKLFAEDPAHRGQIVLGCSIRIEIRKGTPHQIQRLRR